MYEKCISSALSSMIEKSGVNVTIKCSQNLTLNKKTLGDKGNYLMKTIIFVIESVSGPKSSCLHFTTYIMPLFCP